MARNKKKAKSEESGKPPVPESMTTFADMITLMLTFFILLCTFADTQNTEYYAAGVGSFRKAVESMGLPGILNSNNEAMGHTEQSYQHERSRNAGLEEFWEEVIGPLRDENPEALRDALLDSLESKGSVVVPAGIRFSNRSSTLPSEAAGPLRSIVESTRGLDVSVEVIAFGDVGGSSLREQWSLAMKRAGAVGSYLVDTLGVPSSKVTLSGLKPEGEEPTMKGRGEEVLLRLVRP